MGGFNPDPEFDLALRIIRGVLNREGNYGNAWPDEYARYAVKHNLDPRRVSEWAHKVRSIDDEGTLTMTANTYELQEPTVRALNNAVNRMRTALDGDTEYLPALLELNAAVQGEVASLLADYAEMI